VNPKTPFTKIELIQHSLRCFVRGLIGLVPVLGLPFACGAILDFSRVKARQGSLWNPARRYLIWGVVAGGAGLFISTLVAAIVFNAVMSNLPPGG
jgi:hypothetical protein